ncbi:MAG: hypothetical protein HY675_08050 [Chloroflexi bacterium]|nr:hypothetical protein [Chloroflexota bacterium]
MSRVASVRSASFSPEESRLINELADALAGGSFTELTRMLLRYVGLPLKQMLDELRESGIDPHERLFTTHVTPPDSESQIKDFYALSSWPETDAVRD